MRKYREGLDTILFRNRQRGRFDFTRALRPSHECREKRLAELTTLRRAAAHPRSRNDQVATDSRLYVSRHYRRYPMGAGLFQRALVDGRWNIASAVMPGFHTCRPLIP